MRDWENLRYFLAVARNGTVTAAAKDLGVSHSTVLRRIEQFEQALDSRLFKKLQRGYALTTAGETLFTEAKGIEANIDKVLSSAEGHHDVAEGKLRISQPETGILNLYPLYATFLREHPEISLEVHSTMVPHNLNQQEVDVAFRISESPPDLLVGRCLGKFKSRAYASKSYLKNKTASASPSDYEWIIWGGRQNRSMEWLEQLTAKPRIIMYAEAMADVLNAINNNMGVGLLSSHEAEKYPELVAVLDGNVISEYTLWILTHRELRNSYRVTAFMRFMAKNLVLE